jgi:Holliday junction resolvase RusA-like endonuclease
MQIKIEIQGSIPSKKNGKLMICRPYPRLISKPEYQRWKNYQILCLKRYRLDKPIEKCEIEFKYWAKDKRRTDGDNKDTTILDLLVDCEIIKDDSWFCIRKRVSELIDIDKENPRVEILIKVIPC